MNQKSSGQFKFTFKDDYNFNFCIIIDVMYFSSKPVLQAVDFLIFFQAACFLKDMLTRNA